MPALGQESWTRKSIFLSRHTTIGIVFLVTLRLSLILFSVDFTMYIAWQRKPHEFLRTTPKYLKVR